MSLEESSKYILVVDDDSAVRTLVASLLRRRGYAVRTAGNAVEALDLFGREGQSIRLLYAQTAILTISGKLAASGLDAVSTPATRVQYARPLRPARDSATQ